VDIAGLVKGAAEGEGLGNKFLSHIRETDAIAHVVRVFKDPNVIHVHGDPDPKNDIEVINLELVFADLETVRKRLGSVEKEIRGGSKEAVIENEVLQKIEPALADGKPIQQQGLLPDELLAIKHLSLLTAKPMMYVLNTKGEKVDASWIPAGAKWVAVDIKTEGELSLMSEDERKTFAAEIGSSGIEDLIKKAYELLGLITFLTTGEDETRAWTIKKGCTAPEAGTAIHTDFKEKFIRAEVIASGDLLSAGSYAAAREKGLLRTEGKEYIVKDGDVIEFRI
jgi:GTP-binding protein YchF